MAVVNIYEQYKLLKAKGLSDDEIASRVGAAPNIQVSGKAQRSGSPPRASSAPMPSVNPSVLNVPLDLSFGSGGGNPPSGGTVPSSNQPVGRGGAGPAPAALPKLPAPTQGKSKGGSKAEIVARIAQEEGVDPAIADSIWAQESGRSGNLGLRGPTLNKGKWKGHYARGPWQIMSFHGEIPDTFEGQTRWAMKHIKQKGVEGYFGKGTVPGMPNMPTSSEYANQVMARAAGYSGPDVPASSGSTPADTRSALAAQSSVPSGVAALLEGLRGGGGSGGVGGSAGYEPSGMEKFVNSPMFALLAGGTKFGNAMQGIYDRRREGAIREMVAQNLPDQIADIWRYDPSLALRLMDNGSSGSGADDTANIRDHNRYMELMEAEKRGEIAPGTASDFWNNARSQRDPDWQRRFKQGGKEGEKFPERVDESIQDLNATTTAYQAAESTLDKIGEALNLTDTGAGLMQIFSKIPGTDAQRLDHLKTTIASDIGLGELMKLKEASAQGASGLGALNEKELDLLINSVHSLNMAGGPRQVKESLLKIGYHYDRFKDGLKKRYAERLKYYRENRGSLSVPPTDRFEDEIPSYFDQYEKTKERLLKNMDFRRRQGPDYKTGPAAPAESPPPAGAFDWNTRRNGGF